MKSSSYVITLTESHLNSDISDCEINMNGWSIHRSDRVGRKGGGVITLIHEDLIVSEDKSYSDSTSESLMLYINDLNMGLITVYRPPNCDTASFGNNLKNINKWMEAIQKNHPSVTFCITGDFNMGFLKDWSYQEINSFINRTIERKENHATLVDYKAQAMDLIDFCDKWSLSQKIDEGTRNGRILDLLLVNNDLTI